MAGPLLPGCGPGLVLAGPTSSRREGSEAGEATGGGQAREGPMGRLCSPEPEGRPGKRREGAAECRTVWRTS